MHESELHREAMSASARRIYPERLPNKVCRSACVFSLVEGHNRAVQKCFGGKHRGNPHRGADDDDGKKPERRSLHDTSSTPHPDGREKRPRKPGLQGEGNEETGREKEENAERRPGYVEYEENPKIRGRKTDGCNIERIRNVFRP